MNRAGAISVRVWLTLGLSALLAAGTWFVTERWRPFLPSPESELASLTAEHGRLRGFDDEALASWRQKVESLQAEAWTEPALAALPERFGPGWQGEWQSDSQVHLRRTNPALGEWPLYLAFITRWSREPGVAVEAVELAGAGGRFSRVLVTLRFHRGDAPKRDAGRAVPAAAPAGPGPSARHFVPARPSGVGVGS